MDRKILLCLLIITFGNTLFADKRHYVWTYEYATVAPGEGEIETYYTTSTPDMKNMKDNVTVEQQLELEVGMTERFDFGIYNVFVQEPDSGLKFKGYKLRARYRLGEKGQYLMDPLLYLEYKGKPDFSEHGMESKLILAKDFNKVNVAFNPILELEREEDTWELEFEYALGTSYRLSNSLNIGLEAKGSGHGHFLGPVISHGSEHLWVTLGSAFAVSSTAKDSPRFQIRLLLGIGL